MIEGMDNWQTFELICTYVINGRSHMRSMQQMNSMMSSIFDDPFGMMGGFGMGGRPAIGGPRHTQEISPFGAFGFPDLSRMMVI